MWVGRARLLSNWLGSLTILSVIVAISVGLPALNRVLPASRPVAAREPYLVGGGVTVVPPPGALVDLNTTRPGVSRGTALFLIGAIRYVVVVSQYTGSLEEAGKRLRDKITSTRGYQVTGPEFPVTTASGLTGLQGGYTAPGRSGRYAVFVVDELVIEVTVSGTDPDMRAALGEIEASTRSIAYRRPR